MKYKNKCNYKTIVFLVISLISSLLFCGCGKQKDLVGTTVPDNTNAQITKDTQTDLEDESAPENHEGNVATEETIYPFDFSKNCDVVEGENGLYQFRQELSANCYFIGSLKENILFAYWDGLDLNQDGVTGQLRMELYNPVAGEVVKTVTDNNLQSVFVVAAKEQIGVLDQISKRIYLYDVNLELVNMVDFPANMELVNVVSEDLRYVAGTGNEEHNNVCVYDLLENKQIPIDLGGQGDYSIHGILNNDIVVIRGNDSLTKRYYYSIQKGTLLECPELDNYNAGIFSYGNAYFTNYINDAKSGIYFGELDGQHKVIYGDYLLSNPVWLYRGKEMVFQRETEDGQGAELSVYSLENGNQKGQVTIPLEHPYMEQLIICNYVDYYNLAFVTVWNPMEDTTDCYVVDVNSMKEEVECEPVFDLGQSSVRDFGELAPLRQRADAIEEKYGIAIMLGQECRFQEYWTYNCDIVEDYDTINTALDRMEDQLQIYPSDYFKQLQIEQGKPVTFYLAGSIYEKEDVPDQLADCGAFTCFGDNYSYVVIDITLESYSVVWHETMHLTNITIARSPEVNSDEYLDKWSELNPSDFEWTGLDVYSENANPYERYWIDGNAYFINDYGMTNYEEDSATIMEQNLLDAYPFYRQDLHLEEPVYKKLELLCETIRQVFDTSGWPEVLPWEEPLAYKY